MGVLWVVASCVHAGSEHDQRGVDLQQAFDGIAKDQSEVARSAFGSLGSPKHTLEDVIAHRDDEIAQARRSILHLQHRLVTANEELQLYTEALERLVLQREAYRHSLNVQRTALAAANARCAELAAKRAQCAPATAQPGEKGRSPPQTAKQRKERKVEAALRRNCTELAKRLDDLGTWHRALQERFDAEHRELLQLRTERKTLLHEHQLIAGDLREQLDTSQSLVQSQAVALDELRSRQADSGACPVRQSGASQSADCGGQEVASSSHGGAPGPSVERRRQRAPRRRRKKKRAAKRKRPT